MKTPENSKPAPNATQNRKHTSSDATSKLLKPQSKPKPSAQRFDSAKGYEH